MVSNNGYMPKLPNRLNNLDKFSTYMSVLDTQNGYRVIRWKSQPRLRRDLELWAQKDPEFAELLYEQDKGNNVAVFLVNIAVNNREQIHRKLLATQCVAAYLEELCYWVAREVWEAHKEQSWDEYIHIARGFIYDSDKLEDVLAKYNHLNGELNTYVKPVLIGTIKNETEVGKFSDWRLLCQKSLKYLREALSTAGYQEPEISYYIFVRKYFKEVYAIAKVKAPTRKKGEKWPQPDDEDFSKTAALCNNDRQFPGASHEVAVGLPTLTGQQVKEWLNICIQALRYYPNSINPQYSLEALQEQSGDLTTDKSAISSIEELPSKEETTRMQEADGAFREEMKAIKANLEKSIQNKRLQGTYRTMPVLYYGVGLTHTQLAKRFGVNQSNISRHLLKYYEKPLMDCLAGLKKSDEWVPTYVLEWLKKHYSSPLHSDLIQAALVEAIAKLESQHQEVLRLRYGEKMNTQKIARQQGIIESKVDQRIDEALQGLEKALLKAIGKWRKEIVNKWLDKFYLHEIELVVQSALSDRLTATAELLQDFLLQWIQSTANISLDKEEELAKIEKLVVKLLFTGSE